MWASTIGVMTNVRYRVRKSSLVGIVGTFRIDAKAVPLSAA